jgi:hypothetical protein
MMGTIKPHSVSKTLQHELIHFIVALLVAIVLYILSRNTIISVFCFSLGMFLDADHLLDYFLYLIQNKSSFSLREFLSGAYFPIWKHFVTPLHAWELVAASLIIFFYTYQYLFLGIAAALASHYVVDYFTNDVNKKAYFFLFRLKNGFAKAAIRNQ